MTQAEVLKLVKDARKDFGKEMWGHDDDTAVDAFIKILKRNLKELPEGPPTTEQTA
jgi:hypothetical protein